MPTPVAFRLCVHCLLVCVVAFATDGIQAGEVGERIDREGDEIVVCGQLFHTTAPVVLWMDPGGYDAYRVERRFSELDKADWTETVKEVKLDSPNRYGIRKDTLTPEQLEKVRGGGWDLPLLRRVVDQFVLHYDVCGTSEICFKVLHDHRGLSVHFMLDTDGTIYQTLDLKERAWHATISNSRSIGIEIASIGAYPADQKDVLDKWYSTEDGIVRLTPPRTVSSIPGRKKPFYGRPARQKLIEGNIQGTDLYQYDFTPQQYDSLIKLTATLCKIFPKIKCRYPKDKDGELITHILTEKQLKNYHGVLGHYHIQKNKTDPGPALDWDKVIDGATDLMKQSGG